MNKVLSKYLNIYEYSAQYAIDLATGKLIRLYWKIQFNKVLLELIESPSIILPHFHQQFKYTIHILQM